MATDRGRRKRHCCAGVLVVVAEVAGKSPSARNQRPQGARRCRRQVPKDRRPAPRRRRSAVWCLACFSTILSAAANSAIPNQTTATSSATTTATSGARPPDQQSGVERLRATRQRQDGDAAWWHLCAGRRDERVRTARTVSWASARDAVCVRARVHDWKNRLRKTGYRYPGSAYGYWKAQGTGAARLS